MPGQQRKLILVGVALGLLMAAAAVARSAYGIEVSPASLREFVKGAGIWGPLVFIVLLTLRPVLVIPSQLFLISAGICFGTLEGALYAAVGITLGGVAAFLLTRWVGRDAVLSRMPSGVRSVLENGAGMPALAILFVGTAYPIGPVVWFAVAASIAGVALPGFVVTIFAGGFVRAATYSYFGSSLVDAKLHEIVLGAAAIGLVASLPLLHPRVRTYLRRLLRED